MHVIFLNRLMMFDTIAAKTGGKIVSFLNPSWPKECVYFTAKFAAQVLTVFCLYDHDLYICPERFLLRFALSRLIRSLSAAL